MSTTETAPFDQSKLDAFVGRFLGDLGTALHMTTVLVGDRLGLYRAMADGDPISPTLSVSCALGVWRHSWYSSHILPWPGAAMPWRP